jgi:hypothetical protein
MAANNDEMHNIPLNHSRRVPWSAIGAFHNENRMSEGNNDIKIHWLAMQMMAKRKTKRKLGRNHLSTFVSIVLLIAEGPSSAPEATATTPTPGKSITVSAGRRSALVGISANGTTPLVDRLSWPLDVV